MEIVVKTLMGLEGVLADEIAELGGKNIKQLRRAVSCEGSKEFMYELNYLLRTGLNVIVPITEFTAHNYTEIYQGALEIDWTKYISLDQSYVIRCNVHSEFLKNSQYSLLRLKDAISDQFVQKFNRRPSIDKDSPDLTINLRIYEKQIYLQMDSSGDSLFKRGAIKKRGVAPINEVLAAGLIRLSKWTPADNFYDPMCGSGTFLMEALSIAHKIPSQYHRRHWSFMNWPDFDRALWDKVVKNHAPKQTSLDTRFYSSDIDTSALENIELNCDYSHLSFPKQLWQADFFKIYMGVKPGYLFINPPYNVRMTIDDATGWYMRLGKTLKKRYKGWKICVISADLDSLKHLGLKPDLKVEMQAGGLPAMCYMLSVFDR